MLVHNVGLVRKLPVSRASHTLAEACAGARRSRHQVSYAALALPERPGEPLCQVPSRLLTRRSCRWSDASCWRATAAACSTRPTGELCPRLTARPAPAFSAALHRYRPHGLPPALRRAAYDPLSLLLGCWEPSRGAAGCTWRGAVWARGGAFSRARAVGGVGGPGRTVRGGLRCCFYHFSGITFSASPAARIACPALLIA